MIRIKSNIGEISERIREKLNILNDREFLLRPVCFDVIDLMTKRIHVDGKASDDSQIGTYNNSYLKLRERKFKRSGDPKIIVSATRQLENDWSVIATDKGYGIGFLNPFNLQKFRWVEEQKGKTIGNMTKSEGEHAIQTVQEQVRKAFQ